MKEKNSEVWKPEEQFLKAAHHEWSVGCLRSTSLKCVTGRRTVMGFVTVVLCGGADGSQTVVEE